ncbi:hypothetical protein [Nonomuraea africana]|uniref:hypothetical protein n=1 Tax=Nonomuraea africana TaxID=46171 RepID=UPI0033C4FB09
MSHTGAQPVPPGGAVLSDEKVLADGKVPHEKDVTSEDRVRPQTVVQTQVETEDALHADVVGDAVLTEGATDRVAGPPSGQVPEEELPRFEDGPRGPSLSQDAAAYLRLLQKLYTSRGKGVSWRSAPLEPVYHRMKELIKRVKTMIAEIAEFEERKAPLHRYFADTLVDDLNALYALIVHFARRPEHDTWRDDPTEEELILHLFRMKSGTRYLSGDGDLGHTPPTSMVTQCRVGGKTFRHKGLPILVIKLEHLPPAIVMTILEIRNRRGVSGVVYEGKDRDTEPKTAGGLRSWHQNELGLLPPPPKGDPTGWARPRGRSYHDFWTADSVEGLAGRQKDKNLKIGETGLYELTVVGTRSADIRLLYDYARDRFFLTFHYKIILAPDNTTTRPKTKQLSVAAEELKLPTEGEKWTSGLFLVDLPLDSPCVSALASNEEEKEKEDEKPSAKPFPRMLVGPKLAKGGVSLQVPKALWDQAIKAFNQFQEVQDPPRPRLRPGNEESEMIVYNYVTKTFFDFHLTCICDKKRQNIKRIHLAVRLTGCHTSVIYWWYALSWTETPPEVKKIMELWEQKKQPAKGRRIDLGKVAWHLEGEPNGHGVAELTSFWERIEPYEPLLDGTALLDRLLEELLSKASHVEVVTSQSEEDKGKVFFRLHQ